MQSALLTSKNRSVVTGVLEKCANVRFSGIVESTLLEILAEDQSVEDLELIVSNISGGMPDLF